MSDDTKPRAEQLIPHHFKPGQSGFAGRRHKYAYYRSLIEDLNPIAAEVLREAMLYGSPKEKIVAAKVVLEFGLGKPVQENTQENQEKPKGITMKINGVTWEVPAYEEPSEDVIDV